MFRDNIPTFPDDKLILGCYLGPTIDVGSALTAKILKTNGQFVCRSTMRHLTDEERNCLVHVETRKTFDAGITEALGPSATISDFPAEDLTPEYDHYDEDIYDLDPDYGNIEVTPETGDTFIGAEILLSQGGTMTRGRVTTQKRDMNVILWGPPMITRSWTGVNTS